ncbi:MAG: hypothetical protein ETSY2_48325 [Candidatus Entotheonella gemina]|uniref:CobW/HypB/UreG nucleotide-binding domain-containing protein n=1 Tax=Candidatus Entotheonella gemina TaxID=1429439 RepID=W4LBH1_9BACT|nr:MAG: hypothetical protein ETSY2_48325 [Candidatus Entotheonella gemina]
MSKVIIACVGGFLGAGKTTALQRAVVAIRERGLRVGVITNDQGTELVDTEAIRSLNVPTEEIGGGCFCCKFDDLALHAKRLLDYERPDVILAEAVGSCTDLSATVYQPLRKYYKDEFDLAPLSILVEPSRIRAFVGSGDDGFPDTVRYLFEKQLAEADLIVLNKADTVDDAEREELTQAVTRLAGTIPVRTMSALTSEGVDGWIETLLTERAAGNRILDIDYETYAQAEAVLGWLNARVRLTAQQEVSPKAAAEALIGHIQSGSLDAGMAIAHVKILAQTDAGSDRIALTDGQGKPQWSSEKTFPATNNFVLVVNARIRTNPEALSKLVEQSLAAMADTLGLETDVERIASFSPPPPNPPYRFTEKVS